MMLSFSYPNVMLPLNPNVQILLCTQPVDMRKSYDGLSALVTSQLQKDPSNGQLFVFINKRKTHMKILYFDRTGYCIWCKRLEQGQFNFSSTVLGQRTLAWTDLQLLIEGIEVKQVRQYKRYTRD